MTQPKVSGQSGFGQQDGGEIGAVCEHCSDALVRGRVVAREIDGQQQSFCCQGCAFIAEQIAFARARLTPPVDDESTGERPPPARQMERSQIKIRGMACAACALLIEVQLRATPGVAVANVDFVARRATIVYDRNRIALPALQRAVEGAGYRVVSGVQPEAERRAGRVERLRVVLAWLAMVQVMMLAVPAYLAQPGQIGPALGQLLRVAQAALVIPVLLFSAAPLWRAAVSQLRAGQVAMDVPVALSLTAAFGASVFSLVAGAGAVYFDSIAMFVALLLSVRWWQQRALMRASAFNDAAVERTASEVQRLLNHPHSSEFETITPDRLTPDDQVIVPAGARVPADGRVIQGRSALSQAWLTGESAPVDVAPGALVLEGSLNLDQPLLVEVLRSGERTSLSALQRLIVEAGSQRPRPVELANRVAARFVLVLLGASAGTALGWALVDPSAALSNAIAVLIAACPCALSLAAPLATAVAQATLARRGILLARGSALEELSRVDAVAFDKTGTLTEAELAVTGILSMCELDDGDCLRIAASLESRSAHPFARALGSTARQARVALVSVSSVTEVAGAGVEGVVDGRRYRLGKPDYALALVAEVGPALDFALTLAAECSQGGIGLVLADQDGPVAMIRFGERIRAGASSVLAQLARDGTEVMVVSGDRRAAVEAMAADLRDPTLQIHAGQTPAGKQALLACLQRRGRRIAMIGDGINNAPVLAQADASIVLAPGTDLAQARADIICLRPSLADVGFVFEMARRTTHVVRTNLGWALACNAAMVPLAMAGWLSPLTASVGMALSSAVVLANSVRLGLRRTRAATPTAASAGRRE
ncbi:MAG TPA: heavy metal translocating P-type ATPase [Burkholderiaceae bacterium]|jgi:Cu2+-exporting ATPase|nr:heavy metal translocating P-type ATPase [Burkholderiaceae bacterium]